MTFVLNYLQNIYIHTCFSCFFTHMDITLLYSTRIEQEMIVVFFCSIFFSKEKKREKEKNLNSLTFH